MTSQSEVWSSYGSSTSATSAKLRTISEIQGSGDSFVDRSELLCSDNRWSDDRRSSLDSSPGLTTSDDDSLSRYTHPERMQDVRDPERVLLFETQLPPSETCRRASVPLKFPISKHLPAPHHLRANSAPAAFLSFKASVSTALHRRRQSASSFSSLSVGPNSFDDPTLDDLSDLLRTRLQMLGEHNPQVGQNFNEIGNMLFRKGDFNAAADAYASALRCYKLHAASCAVDSVSDGSDGSSKNELESLVVAERQLPIAVTLVNFGTLCWRTGRFDESVTCLEEALRIQARVFSKRSCASLAGAYGDHVWKDQIEVSGTLYNLGIARTLNGDYDLAFKALTRSLKVRVLAYGKNHLEVARTLDALGKVYFLLDNMEDAMECHMEALKTKMALMGVQHASVVFSMTNVASVYWRSGNLKEAERMYREVLRLQTGLITCDTSSVGGAAAIATLIDMAATALSLGQICMEKGDHRGAEKEFMDGLCYFEEAGLSEEEDERVVAMKSVLKLCQCSIHDTKSRH